MPLIAPPLRRNRTVSLCYHRGVIGRWIAS